MSIDPYCKRQKIILKSHLKAQGEFESQAAKTERYARATLHRCTHRVNGNCQLLERAQGAVLGCGGRFICDQPKYGDPEAFVCAQKTLESFTVSSSELAER